jgi:hypothetical protein
MTYGFVMDVPAPIEAYDALHAEIARRGNGTGYGMLLHIGRATPSGFQVIEIWESKEQRERFDAEVMGPALAALSGGQPAPPPPPMEEFEPRGLIVPAAHVAV